MFSPLLPALRDGTLSPQDRMGLLNDAFALVRQCSLLVVAWFWCNRWYLSIHNSVVFIGVGTMGARGGGGGGCPLYFMMVTLCWIAYTWALAYRAPPLSNYLPTLLVFILPNLILSSFSSSFRHELVLVAQWMSFVCSHPMWMRHRTQSGRTWLETSPSWTAFSPTLNATRISRNLLPSCLPRLLLGWAGTPRIQIVRVMSFTMMSYYITHLPSYSGCDAAQPCDWSAWSLWRHRHHTGGPEAFQWLLFRRFIPSSGPEGCCLLHLPGQWRWLHLWPTHQG